MHFTRSAQLGPVWESRAAASVGVGPLNEKYTHHALEQTNVHMYNEVFTVARWDFHESLSSSYCAACLRCFSGLQTVPI